MKALVDLFRRLDRDEEGAVSIETILIIGAIALPILIFLIKIGWPRIQQYFATKVEELEGEGDNASNTDPFTTGS